MPLSTKKLLTFCFFLLIAFWIGYSCVERKESGNSVSLESIPLSGEIGGIGFDDLNFAPALKKILVPGGRTGTLYLVDSLTHEVIPITGFSFRKEYQGGHGDGITSADEGKGLIFVTDRTAKTLHAVDPKLRKIVASVSLASGPDYVRYIPATHEVWVTQPGDEQIEVFSLSDKPSFSHAAFISVPGGPESLIYDDVHERAYINLWLGKTVALDVKSKKLLSEWPNGCHGSRGIALDHKLRFLFVGCAEGKATLLDLNHDGNQLASIRAGPGTDVISYNPHLRRLYLPGSESATLSIVNVSEKGELELARELKIEKHSQCVTSDDLGNVWVCDPDHGHVLFFNDSP